MTVGFEIQFQADERTTPIDNESWTRLLKAVGNRAGVTEVLSDVHGEGGIAILDPEISYEDAVRIANSVHEILEIEMTRVAPR
jgi:hypothetical protein